MIHNDQPQPIVYNRLCKTKKSPYGRFFFLISYFLISNILVTII